MSLHKSFSSMPTRAYDSHGEVNLSDVMQEISNDIHLIKDMVEWHLNSDDNLLSDIDKSTSSKNNYIGKSLGCSIPQEFLMSRKSGKSRYQELFRDSLIREAKSWNERIKVCEGSSQKYISQGWKRTSNPNKPSVSPKISLSAVDKQFAFISNTPFEDGEIHLKMVCGGKWNILAFPFDKKRFSGGSKVCLPDIVVKDNKVLFHFSVQYEYVYSEFSDNYVMGIDVGVNSPVTVAIANKDGDIVHSTQLSQRVDSLKNSIVATEKQIKFLHIKLSKNFSDEVYCEIQLQRKSLSRKRRELAILIGQEVSDIQQFWDNPIVVVEDLSWVSNTMKNGRWNRGDVVKWIKHYVELNGGRVIRASSYNTSKVCHQCGELLKVSNWNDVSCNCGFSGDRDVNAAANIANKIRPKTLPKMVQTRKKAKKSTKKLVKRNPPTRQSLKYPGRDRTKNHPTPKRKNCNKKKVEVNNIKCSPTSNNDWTVVGDGGFESESSTRTLKKQHGIINDGCGTYPPIMG